MSLSRIVTRSRILHPSPHVGFRSTDSALDWACFKEGIDWLLSRAPKGLGLWEKNGTTVL